MAWAVKAPQKLFFDLPSQSLCVINEEWRCKRTVPSKKYCETHPMRFRLQKFFKRFSNTDIFTLLSNLPLDHSLLTFSNKDIGIFIVDLCQVILAII